MDYAMIGILTVIGILSGSLAALVGGGADVLIVPMMLLFSVFSNIKLAASPVLCTLAYRTLSCNHLHSLHSTTWQLQAKGSNNGLVIWKGLDKLPEVEEKKSEGRTVRWRNEVGIGRKELLKEANTLLEVGT